LAALVASQQFYDMLQISLREDTNARLLAADCDFRPRHREFTMGDVEPIALNAFAAFRENLSPKAR
jgi:hypothetical protein